MHRAIFSLSSIRGTDQRPGTCVKCRMVRHWENDMKRMVMAGIAALMLTVGSVAAVSAMPSAPMAAAADTIQIRGGHGHGHGHGGMHRGGRGHHYGWSRGRGHHYGWSRGRGHRHHW